MPIDFAGPLLLTTRPEGYRPLGFGGCITCARCKPETHLPRYGRPQIFSQSTFAVPETTTTPLLVLPANFLPMVKTQNLVYAAKCSSNGRTVRSRCLAKLLYQPSQLQLVKRLNRQSGQVLSGEAFQKSEPRRRVHRKAATPAEECSG